MLKSEIDTKAVSASRMFFSSTVTYTANVVKATWEHMGKADHSDIKVHRFSAERRQSRDARQSVTQQGSKYQQHHYGVIIDTDIHLFWLLKCSFTQLIKHASTKSHM